MNMLTTLAQAGSSASSSGDGAGVIGFLVIVGFLWAICAACNRKKTYDFNGTVRER